MPEQPALNEDSDTKLTQEHARAQISIALPLAIVDAIASYEAFKARHDNADDMVEFKVFHTACMAALKHIEALIKLSTWASIDPDEGDTEDALSTMHDIFLNAQKELNAYNVTKNEIID